MSLIKIYGFVGISLAFLFQPVLIGYAGRSILCDCVFHCTSFLGHVIKSGTFAYKMPKILQVGTEYLQDFL